tara:strand:- start:4471 stop:5082 length:612 start_codon:yes stop_codon:yes gene_type:complete
MVGVSAGGAAGLATSILIAAKSAWRGEEPPKVRLETNPSFLTPDWDPAQPKCEFYNASYVYEKGLCSHFSIARMGPSVQQEALSRALDCATAHETDCLLSPEVGLTVPAAFVYDNEMGLKMLIAPKFLPLPAGIDPEPKLIDVQMPVDGRRTGMQVAFNSSVLAEFLEGGSREIKQSLLTGTAAHCAQLLRVAFAEDCWNLID